MRGGGDDDETTSKRDKDELPRAPVLPSGPPERPTLPGRMRTSTRRGVSPDPMDDGPTMIDPEVPTGARERPGRFDPTARLDDNRMDPPTGPTARIDDRMPTDPTNRIEDNRRTMPRAATPAPIDDDVLPPPSGPTMIGKRSANVAKSGPRPAPIPGSGPRVAPVPPQEVPPARAKEPVKFDPYGRIDDASRTNKWEAQQLDPLATPPVQQPMPPVLPLQPGPRSEPIQVVSMKTPDIEESQKVPRQMPEVRLRAMSEVRPQTPPRGMGYLAPPRDPKEARSRRRRDAVIWGSVAIIVASVVMLAVWFLAR